MAEKRYKTTALDFVGKEINAGDIVAYGKALGRCAGLNVGVVTDVWSPIPEDKRGNLTPYEEERIHRITMYTNQDSWKSFSERDPEATDSWSNSKKTKKTTILFSNRCVVISNPKDLGDSKLAKTLTEVSEHIKNGGTI